MVYLAALASQVLSASGGVAGFEVLDVGGGPVLALGGGVVASWGVVLILTSVRDGRCG